MRHGTHIFEVVTRLNRANCAPQWRTALSAQQIPTPVFYVVLYALCANARREGFNNWPKHTYFTALCVGNPVFSCVFYAVYYLCVSVYAVRRPAARLHLIRVQAPELQLLLEQRSAHIGRIVQLARPAPHKMKKTNPTHIKQSTAVPGGVTRVGVVWMVALPIII